MRNPLRSCLVAVALVGVFTPTTVFADTPKRISGHVGFVIPTVSRADGQTTTVADDFVIGFPVGIGVAKVGRFAVDLEVVTFWQNEPSDISVLLHPGLVTPVGKGVAAGVRAAFDVEGDAWGFTPLVNRALYTASTHKLFGEVVVPVRFVDGPGGHTTSIGLGVHIGIGF